MNIEITTYRGEYKQQIIDLILHIQNDEAGINLSLEEQPDLLNIRESYEKEGGEFWVAIMDGNVIGTLAIMNKGNGNAVLKKGFVKKEYRKHGILTQLYEVMMTFAKEKDFSLLLFDTPSVTTDCHHFFEKREFIRITKDEIPFHYEYPDRNSYLYIRKLKNVIR